MKVEIKTTNGYREFTNIIDVSGNYVTAARSWVKAWNNNRQPEEYERRLIYVKPVSGTDHEDHEWIIGDLVYNGELPSYNRATCSKCGITGKRFVNTNRVVRTARYKAAAYANCLEARQRIDDKLKR